MISFYNNIKFDKNRHGGLDDKKIQYEVKI